MESYEIYLKKLVLEQSWNLEIPKKKFGPVNSKFKKLKKW
jgi:hypothetical protein